MTISNETAAASLEEAVQASCVALDAVADLDWTSPAHELEWSIRQTAEHIGSCLLGYAGQVVGEPDEGWVIPDAPLEDDMTSADAVAYIRTAGQILSIVVRATPPSGRAYHVYGRSDPVGFAAMGIIESLVHTHDVMRALGVDWLVPTGPCRLAAERLFTAEVAELGQPQLASDPVGVLLWCCGRQPLGEREQRGRWRWNGVVPE
jgi:hypothetical protein